MFLDVTPRNLTQQLFIYDTARVHNASGIRLTQNAVEFKAGVSRSHLHHERSEISTILGSLFDYRAEFLQRGLSTDNVDFTRGDYDY